jgi:uncharacterized DUF497 family protein
VEFEFDPRKSESNMAKHGIDFVGAQALWRTKYILLPAKDAFGEAIHGDWNDLRPKLVPDYHLSRSDNSHY